MLEGRPRRRKFPLSQISCNTARRRLQIPDMKTNQTPLEAQRLAKTPSGLIPHSPRTAPPLYSVWLGLLLLFTCFPTFQAQAQTEMFMRFRGTTKASAPIGDSTDPVYSGSNGWFRVTSFHCGILATNQTVSGSGTPVVRVETIELQITKGVTGISPWYLGTLVRGLRLGSTEVVVRRAGAPHGLAYLSYEFGLPSPRHQTWSGGGDDPQEFLQMHYESLTLTFRPTAPDGSFGTPISQTWESGAAISPEINP